MHRYEEDDIDALGYFALIGALACLFLALLVFIALMGWL